MAGDEPDIQEALCKRAFTNWINHTLKKHSPPYIVNDLYKDVRSGVVILALIEQLTGQKLDYKTGNNLRILDFIQNLDLAIQTLEKNGVSLGRMKAYDIFEGKERTTNGLIWNIILYFEIRIQDPEAWNVLTKERKIYSQKRSITEDSKEYATAKNTAFPDFPMAMFNFGAPRKILQDWCNKLISNTFDVDSSNFSRSVREETILLNTLLNYLEQIFAKQPRTSQTIDSPGALAAYSGQDELDLDKAKIIYERVGEKFGLTALNFDMLRDRFEERSIVTYLIHYFQQYILFLKRKTKEESRKSNVEEGSQPQKEPDKENLDVLMHSLKQGVYNMINQADPAISYIAQKEYLIWCKIMNHNGSLYDSMRSIYCSSRNTDPIYLEVWNNLEACWIRLEQIKKAWSNELNDLLFNQIYQIYFVGDEKGDNVLSSSQTLYGSRSYQLIPGSNKDTTESKGVYLEDKTSRLSLESSQQKLDQSRLDNKGMRSMAPSVLNINEVGVGSQSTLSQQQEHHHASNTSSGQGMAGDRQHHQRQSKGRVGLHHDEASGSSGVSSKIKVDPYRLAAIYQFLTCHGKVKEIFNLFNKALDRYVTSNKQYSPSLLLSHHHQQRTEAETEVAVCDPNLNENLTCLLHTLKNLVKSVDHSLLLESSKCLDAEWPAIINHLHIAIDDIEIVSNAWDMYKPAYNQGKIWLDNVEISQKISLDEVESHEDLFDEIDKYGSILAANCPKYTAPVLHEGFDRLMERWTILKKEYEKCKTMDNKSWFVRSESSKLVGVNTGQDKHSFNDSYEDSDSGQSVIRSSSYTKKFKESIRDKEVVITKMNERVVLKPVPISPSQTTSAGKEAESLIYFEALLPTYQMYSADAARPRLDANFDSYLERLKIFERKCLEALHKLKADIRGDKSIGDVQQLESLIDNKVDNVENALEGLEISEKHELPRIEQRLETWESFMKRNNLSSCDANDIPEMWDRYKELIDGTAIPTGEILNQLVLVYNKTINAFPYANMEFAEFRTQMEAFIKRYEANVMESNRFDKELKNIIVPMTKFVYLMESVYKYIGKVKDVLRSNLRDSQDKSKKFTIKMDEDILRKFVTQSDTLMKVLLSNIQKTDISDKVLKTQHDWEKCQAEITLASSLNNFRVHEARFKVFILKVIKELRYELETFKSGNFELNSIMDRHVNFFTDQNITLPMKEDLENMANSAEEFNHVLEGLNRKGADDPSYTNVGNDADLINTLNGVLHTEPCTDLTSFNQQISRDLSDDLTSWSNFEQELNAFKDLLRTAIAQRTNFNVQFDEIVVGANAIEADVENIMGHLKFDGRTDEQTDPGAHGVDKNMESIKVTLRSIETLMASMTRLEGIVDSDEYSVAVPETIVKNDVANTAVLRKNLKSLLQFLQGLLLNYGNRVGPLPGNVTFSQLPTRENIRTHKYGEDVRETVHKDPHRYHDSHLTSQSSEEDRQQLLLHQQQQYQQNVLHKKIKLDLPAFDMGNIEVAATGSVPPLPKDSEGLESSSPYYGQSARRVGKSLTDQEGSRGNTDLGTSKGVKDIPTSYETSLYVPIAKPASVVRDSSDDVHKSVTSEFNVQLMPPNHKFDKTHTGSKFIVDSPADIEQSLDSGGIWPNKLSSTTIVSQDTRHGLQTGQLTERERRDGGKGVESSQKRDTTKISSGDDKDVAQIAGTNDKSALKASPKGQKKVANDNLIKKVDGKQTEAAFKDKTTPLGKSMEETDTQTILKQQHPVNLDSKDLESQSIPLKELALNDGKDGEKTPGQDVGLKYAQKEGLGSNKKMIIDGTQVNTSNGKLNAKGEDSIIGSQKIAPESKLTPIEKKKIEDIHKDSIIKDDEAPLKIIPATNIDDNKKVTEKVDRESVPSQVLPESISGTRASKSNVLTDQGTRKDDEPQALEKSPDPFVTFHHQYPDSEYPDSGQPEKDDSTERPGQRLSRDLSLDEADPSKGTIGGYKTVSPARGDEPFIGTSHPPIDGTTYSTGDESIVNKIRPDQGDRVFIEFKDTDVPSRDATIILPTEDPSTGDDALDPIKNPRVDYNNYPGNTEQVNESINKARDISTGQSGDSDNKGSIDEESKPQGPIVFPEFEEEGTKTDAGIGEKDQGSREEHVKDITTTNSVEPGKKYLVLDTGQLIDGGLESKIGNMGTTETTLKLDEGSKKMDENDHKSDSLSRAKMGKNEVLSNTVPKVDDTTKSGGKADKDVSDVGIRVKDFMSEEASGDILKRNLRKNVDDVRRSNDKFDKATSGAPSKGLTNVADANLIQKVDDTQTETTSKAITTPPKSLNKPIEETDSLTILKQQHPEDLDSTELKSQNTISKELILNEGKDGERTSGQDVGFRSPHRESLGSNKKMLIDGIQSDIIHGKLLTHGEESIVNPQKIAPEVELTPIEKKKLGDIHKDSIITDDEAPLKIIPATSVDDNKKVTEKVDRESVPSQVLTESISGVRGSESNIITDQGTRKDDDSQTIQKSPDPFVTFHHQYPDSEHHHINEEKTDSTQRPGKQVAHDVSLDEMNDTKGIMEGGKTDLEIIEESETDLSAQGDEPSDDIKSVENEPVNYSTPEATYELDQRSEKIDDNDQRPTSTGEAKVDKRKVRSKVGVPEVSVTKRVEKMEKEIPDSADLVIHVKDFMSEDAGGEIGKQNLAEEVTGEGEAEGRGDFSSRTSIDGIEKELPSEEDLKRDSLSEGSLVFPTFEEEGTKTDAGIVLSPMTPVTMPTTDGGVHEKKSFCFDSGSGVVTPSPQYKPDVETEKVGNQVPVPSDTMAHIIVPERPNVDGRKPMETAEIMPYSSGSETVPINLNESPGPGLKGDTDSKSEEYVAKYIKILGPESSTFSVDDKNLHGISRDVVDIVQSLPSNDKGASKGKAELKAPDSGSPPQHVSSEKGYPLSPVSPFSKFYQQYPNDFDNTSTQDVSGETEGIPDSKVDEKDQTLAPYYTSQDNIDKSLPGLETPPNTPDNQSDIISYGSKDVKPYPSKISVKNKIKDEVPVGKGGNEPTDQTHPSTAALPEDTKGQENRVISGDKLRSNVLSNKTFFPPHDDGNLWQMDPLADFYPHSVPRETAELAPIQKSIPKEMPSAKGFEGENFDGSHKLSPEKILHDKLHQKLDEDHETKEHDLYYDGELITPELDGLPLTDIVKKLHKEDHTIVSVLDEVDQAPELTKDDRNVKRDWKKKVANDDDLDKPEGEKVISDAEDISLVLAPPKVISTNPHNPSQTEEGYGVVHNVIDKSYAQAEPRQEYTDKHLLNILDSQIPKERGFKKINTTNIDTSSDDDYNLAPKDRSRKKRHNVKKHDRKGADVKPGSNQYESGHHVKVPHDRFGQIEPTLKSSHPEVVAKDTIHGNKVVRGNKQGDERLKSHHLNRELSPDPKVYTSEAVGRTHKTEAPIYNRFENLPIAEDIHSYTVAKGSPKSTNLKRPDRGRPLNDDFDIDDLPIIDTQTIKAKDRDSTAEPFIDGGMHDGNGFKVYHPYHKLHQSSHSSTEEFGKSGMSNRGSDGNEIRASDNMPIPDDILLRKDVRSIKGVRLHIPTTPTIEELGKDLTSSGTKTIKPDTKHTYRDKIRYQGKVQFKNDLPDDEIDKVKLESENLLLKRKDQTDIPPGSDTQDLPATSKMNPKEPNIRSISPPQHKDNLQQKQQSELREKIPKQKSFTGRDRTSENKYQIKDSNEAEEGEDYKVYHDYHRLHQSSHSPSSPSGAQISDSNENISSLPSQVSDNILSEKDVCHAETPGIHVSNAYTTEEFEKQLTPHTGKLKKVPIPKLDKPDTKYTDRDKIKHKDKVQFKNDLLDDDVDKMKLESENLLLKRKDKPDISPGSETKETFNIKAKESNKRSISPPHHKDQLQHRQQPKQSDLKEKISKQKSPTGGDRTSGNKNKIKDTTDEAEEGEDYKVHHDYHRLHQSSHTSSSPSGAQISDSNENIPSLPSQVSDIILSEKDFRHAETHGIHISKAYTTEEFEKQLTPHTGKLEKVPIPKLDKPDIKHTNRDKLKHKDKVQFKNNLLDDGVDKMKLESENLFLKRKDKTDISPGSETQETSKIKAKEINIRSVSPPQHKDRSQQKPQPKHFDLKEKVSKQKSPTGGDRTYENENKIKDVADKAQEGGEYKVHHDYHRFHQSSHSPSPSGAQISNLDKNSTNLPSQISDNIFSDKDVRKETPGIHVSKASTTEEFEKQLTPHNGKLEKVSVPKPDKPDTKHTDRDKIKHDEKVQFKSGLTDNKAVETKLHPDIPSKIREEIVLPVPLNSELIINDAISTVSGIEKMGEIVNKYSTLYPISTFEKSSKSQGPEINSFNDTNSYMSVKITSKDLESNNTTQGTNILLRNNMYSIPDGGSLVKHDLEGPPTNTENSGTSYPKDDQKLPKNRLEPRLNDQKGIPYLMEENVITNTEPDAQFKSKIIQSVSGHPDTTPLLSGSANVTDIEKAYRMYLRSLNYLDKGIEAPSGKGPFPKVSADTDIKGKDDLGKISQSGIVPTVDNIPIPSGQHPPSSYPNFLSLRLLPHSDPNSGGIVAMERDPGSPTRSKPSVRNGATVDDITNAFRIHLKSRAAAPPDSRYDHGHPHPYPLHNHPSLYSVRPEVLPIDTLISPLKNLASGNVPFDNTETPLFAPGQQAQIGTHSVQERVEPTTRNIAPKVTTDVYNEIHGLTFAPGISRNLTPARSATDPSSGFDILLKESMNTSSTPGKTGLITTSHDPGVTPQIPPFRGQGSEKDPSEKLNKVLRDGDKISENLKKLNPTNLDKETLFNVHASLTDLLDRPNRDLRYLTILWDKSDTQLALMEKDEQNIRTLHDSLNQLEGSLQSPKLGPDAKFPTIDPAVLADVTDLKGKCGQALALISSDRRHLKELLPKMRSFETTLDEGRALLSNPSSPDESRLGGTQPNFNMLDKDFKQLSDLKGLYRLKTEIEGYIKAFDPLSQSVLRDANTKLKDIRDTEEKFGREEMAASASTHQKVRPVAADEFDTRFGTFVDRLKTLDGQLKDKNKQLRGIDANLGAIIPFFEKFEEQSGQISEWVKNHEAVLDDGDKSLKELVDMIPRIQKEKTYYDSLLEESLSANKSILDPSMAMTVKISDDIERNKAGLSHIDQKIKAIINRRNIVKGLQSDIDQECESVRKALQKGQEPSKSNNALKTILQNTSPLRPDDIPVILNVIDIKKKSDKELEKHQGTVKRLNLKIDLKVKGNKEIEKDVAPLIEKVDGLTKYINQLAQKDHDNMQQIKDRLLTDYSDRKIQIEALLKTVKSQLDNLQSPSSTIPLTYDTRLKEVELLSTDIKKLQDLISGTSEIYLNSVLLTLLEQALNTKIPEHGTANLRGRDAVALDIPTIKYETDAMRDKASKINDRFQHMKSLITTQVQDSQHHMEKLDGLESKLVKEASRIYAIDQGHDYDTISDKLNGGLKPALQNFSQTYEPVLKEIQEWASSQPASGQQLKTIDKESALKKVNALITTYYEPTVTWVKDRIRREEKVGEEAATLIRDSSSLVDKSIQDLGPLNDTIQILEIAKSHDNVTGKGDTSKTPKLSQKPAKSKTNGNRKQIIKGGNVIFELREDDDNLSPKLTIPAKGTTKAGDSDDFTLSKFGMVEPYLKNLRELATNNGVVYGSDQTISLRDAFDYLTHLERKYHGLTEPAVLNIQNFISRLPGEYESVILKAPGNGTGPAFSTDGSDKTLENLQRELNTYQAKLKDVPRVFDDAHRRLLAASNAFLDSEIRSLTNFVVSDIEKDSHVHDPKQFTNMDDLMDLRGKLIGKIKKVVTASTTLDAIESQTKEPQINEHLKGKIEALRTTLLRDKNENEEKLAAIEICVSRYWEASKKLDGFQRKYMDLEREYRTIPTKLDTKPMQKIKLDSENLLKDVDYFILNHINTFDEKLSGVGLKQMDSLGQKFNDLKKMIQTLLLNINKDSEEPSMPPISQTLTLTTASNIPEIARPIDNNAGINVPKDQQKLALNRNNVDNNSILSKLTSYLPHPFSTSPKAGRGDLYNYTDEDDSKDLITHQKVRISSGDLTGGGVTLNEFSYDTDDTGFGGSPKISKLTVFENLDVKDPNITLSSTNESKSPRRSQDILSTPDSGTFLYEPPYQGILGVRNKVGDTDDKESKVGHTENNIRHLLQSHIGESGIPHKLDIHALIIKLMDDYDNLLTQGNLLLKRTIEDVDQTAKSSSDDVFNFSPSTSSDVLTATSKNVNKVTVHQLDLLKNQVKLAIKDIETVDDILTSPELYANTFTITKPKNPSSLQKNLNKKYRDLVKMENLITGKMNYKDVLVEDSSLFNESDSTKDFDVSSHSSSIPGYGLFGKLMNLKDKIIFSSFGNSPKHETDKTGTDSSQENPEYLIKIRNLNLKDSSLPLNTKVPLIENILNNVEKGSLDKDGHVSRDIDIIPSSKNYRSLFDDLHTGKRDKNGHVMKRGTPHLNGLNSWRIENDSQEVPFTQSYLYRVLMASIPLQFLLLSLVGLASLLPMCDNDYSCALKNNMLKSLAPTLNYPDGPPPL